MSILKNVNLNRPLSKKPQTSTGYEPAQQTSHLCSNSAGFSKQYKRQEQKEDKGGKNKKVVWKEEKTRKAYK